MKVGDLVRLNSGGPDMKVEEVGPGKAICSWEGGGAHAFPIATLTRVLMGGDPRKILAAKIAHEANRAYCYLLGDESQLPWEQAPQWQKDSALNGVEGVLGGNTAEQSHESWLAEKERTAWKYGPVKDAEKREHPCFVPYDQLPPDQRVKDAIFVGVVRTVLSATGVLS